MTKYCQVECRDGNLVCYLPITTPTGKVRILRREQPIATRRTEFCEGDLIEWQISYFADDHQREVELGILLKLAYQNSLISTSDLYQLSSEIAKDIELFTEKYSISIASSQLPEVFHGFKVLRKVVPVLQKDVEGVQIWVELRHKQRAVGYQPMLYIRIPVEAVRPSLMGRKAQRNEVVVWESPLQLLFEIVKGFSVLSQKHHHDMLSLLQRIMVT